MNPRKVAAKRIDKREVLKNDFLWVVSWLLWPDDLRQGLKTVDLLVTFHRFDMALQSFKFWVDDHTAWLELSNRALNWLEIRDHFPHGSVEHEKAFEEAEKLMELAEAALFKHNPRPSGRG